MTLVVNGEPREVSERVTIRGLLGSLGFESRAVAVAVNSVFVPRSEHDAHELQAGDEVELVAPMQGG